MHDAHVKMKNGSVVVGPVWAFDPQAGFMTIPSDDPGGVTLMGTKREAGQLLFNEIEEAWVEERVGKHEDGSPKVVRVDLLARARNRGWSGT